MSGRGGFFAAGRWHPKGKRVVYSSATLSLAALEILVHTNEDLLPSDLVHLEIEVPDDLDMEHIDAKVLPRGWRAYPAPPILQRLGADWIDRGDSALLRVPSAVIPQENNYLLNPGHADATRFEVVTKANFVFDPRLLK